jgi:glycerol-3-phosphate dehydrogenase
MNREGAVARMRERSSAGEPWDLIVIGGGATGLGIAVDASSRGHATLLVERNDFAAGTSSRSTKLLHGGVRYLEQGNVSLVREALAERDLALANAPHLSWPLAIVVPCRSYAERAFYRTGLWLYDRLAGRSMLPASRGLSGADLGRLVPGLAARVGDRKLVGGVLYHDGQFDDARMALALARTASLAGACVVNHAEVESLVRAGASDRVAGAVVRDRESGERFACRGRAVVNATGPFCDGVRRLDDPRAEPIIAASQGVHLVLPARFLPGAAGVIVPRTPDGRVIFALPWRDRVVVGTTDTPLEAVATEPRPLEKEVEFLLELCGRYMAAPPARSDILAWFTGVRPLVHKGGKVTTSRLSRDHSILVSDTGLVSVTGGKWTTYRRMAEQTVDLVERVAALGRRPCRTRTLRLHGSPAAGSIRVNSSMASPGGSDRLAWYGTDAAAIHGLARECPALAAPIHPRLETTGAEIVFAVRQEMARTVEDILSRRTRDLVRDARAAVEAAPAVADLLAAELGRDAAWAAGQVDAFRETSSACVPA